jgi:hypothetical protein
VIGAEISTSLAHILLLLRRNGRKIEGFPYVDQLPQQRRVIKSVRREWRAYLKITVKSFPRGILRQRQRWSTTSLETISQSPLLIPIQGYRKVIEWAKKAAEYNLTCLRTQ